MRFAQRVVALEKLYTPLLSALLASGRYSTETEARRALDQIFLMGKVEGRATACSGGTPRGAAEDDRLIQDWLSFLEVSG